MSRKLEGKVALITGAARGQGRSPVYEIVLQLQGRAGDRQVPNNPRVGYTHLYGAAGASAVSILSR